MVFKLGDKVTFGGVQGCIVQIDRSRELPLLVKFHVGVKYRFTLDGRVSHKHLEPLLHHHSKEGDSFYDSFKE